MSGCGFEHGLVEVEHALTLIQETIQQTAIQSLPVSDALHYFLAEDVYSDVQLPIFDQSAVDGYAICATDTMRAGQTLELLAPILQAGQTNSLVLQTGQAVRIFTGAKIPTGTTTVARQEIVRVLPSATAQAQSTQIELTSELTAHADIRDAGEEVTYGQLLAAAGQQLNVGTIAALSMAGIKHVKVATFPRVAVVVTGDEVAQNIADHQSGKVFDANTPMIAAWFTAQGRQADYFHVADDKQAVTDLLNDLKVKYDLLITTGGVSVGDFDFIRPVALENGFQQIFWKIKQKPGKPMLFAHFQHQSKANFLNDQSSEANHHCYLLGLPGNPAAVFVCLQVYVSTALKALQGQVDAAPKWQYATLESQIKPDARDRFLRMVVKNQQGQLMAHHLPRQQSHMLSNLVHANALVYVPAQQTLDQGQLLKFIWL